MRVLITGATGQLGPYLVEAAERQGWEVVAWSGQRVVPLTERITSQAVPLQDAEAVRRAWVDAAPDAVLHAGAMARVNECASFPTMARQVNVEGTARLCELAAARGAPVVYVSTDLVFDGEAAPYDELAVPRPLSHYGRTKLEAEQVVRQEARNCVCRLALLYGPGRAGAQTFLDYVIEQWSRGQVVMFFHDEWRTPLSLQDAAAALVLALAKGLRGCYHVGGPERLSRWEMGRRLAAAVGVPEELVAQTSRLAINFPELRPRDVSLDSSKFRAAVPGWSPKRFPEPWYETTARRR